MLKAIVSYSKKIPVPNAEYSSQGFSLSLETEIAATEPGKIQSQLHETFDLVKTSVEQELLNAGGPSRAVPADPPVPPGPARDTRMGKATNKQVKYVTDLWTADGGSVSDLNARILRDYHVQGLYDLDRKQASALLDQLKQENRQAA